MRRQGTGASDGAGVDAVNTTGLEAKAERSNRRSSGSKCFTSAPGIVSYHSRGSEQPRAMAQRLICIEINNRSVEGLPTQHNTRAHAVRNSVHIYCFRKW